MTTPTIAHALTVTSENAHAVIGMSWKWIYAFARAHDVPIWHFARKPIIPSAPLLAALQRAAEAAPALTEADVLARLEAEATQRHLNRAKP